MAPRNRQVPAPAPAPAAVETFEIAKTKVSQALTIGWDELSPWMQDNHYILHGYRRESFSVRKCIGSLLYFHNETVNVYSHLLGALGFLYTWRILYLDVSARYPQATSADLLAFASFFISCATCFGLSASFHLTANHSAPGAQFGSKLDYLGIVIFIVGSYTPSIYYGLRCDPGVMYAYWGMMFTIGTACGIATMKSGFHTPKFRAIRATMFAGLGLCSIFPLLHGTWMYSYATLEERMGLRWSIWQGALYLTGTTIYALRVPERWWPGAFDLLGSSHQILHFCAVAAAAAQLKALIAAYDFWHQKGRGTQGVC